MVQTCQLHLVCNMYLNSVIVGPDSAIIQDIIFNCHLLHQNSNIGQNVRGDRMGGVKRGETEWEGSRGVRQNGRSQEG